MNSIIITVAINSAVKLSYVNDNLAVAKCDIRIGDFKKLELVAFGKLAERLAEYSTNLPLLISGELHDLTIQADSIEVVPDSLKVNIINLAGRVGQEPEVRHTQDGKPVANVSLAVRRTKEVTDWFRCTLWERQAEIAGEWVRKGGLIGVSGRLGFDTWKDRNTGELRHKPVVTCDRLELLGGKRQEQHLGDMAA